MTKEDFFKRTERNERGCILWIKGLQHKYGSLRIGNKSWRAHRYSWTIHNGDIPNGMYVLHRCDTPACVNPEHLFLGTHSENMQDKISKGRDHNQRKTHCPKGHEYSYIDPSGSRKCRVCVLESGRKHYQRNIEEIRERKRVAVLEHYRKNKEAINARRRALKKARKEAQCSMVNQVPKKYLQDTVQDHTNNTSTVD